MLIDGLGPSCAETSTTGLQALMNENFNFVLNSLAIFLGLAVRLVPALDWSVGPIPPPRARAVNLLLSDRVSFPHLRDPRTSGFVSFIADTA